MFEELMGAFGGRLVVAVLGVGLALLCLVGILWIVRGRNGPSPFVRGGRNRQPRLQVLDAAAVDTRRRLVLIRRDDVEHLVMIGGPTDIVIESRIATNPSMAAPEPAELQPAIPVAKVPAAVSPPPTRQPAPEANRPVQPIAAPRIEPDRPVATEQKNAIPAQPALQAAAVAPVTRPAASPRVEIRNVDPAVHSPAPVVATTPPVAAPTTFPAAERAAAPAARLPETSPVIDNAAKLLDTARDRVFAERPASPPASRPSAPSGETGKPLGSEFEKILEAEMANNLAARDAALTGRVAKPAPQGGALPSASGEARSEPSLQSEVARIFGEMSASRDK